MYTPTFNQITDRAILIEAMRAHSFAILFGPLNGESTASATHLPLIVRDQGPHGVLYGHFARANAHCSALAGREALVVFPGPHSYISPAHYTQPLSVPTWNYIAVHAHGTLNLIEDESGRNALVEELIVLHEPAYLNRWRAMPESYRRNMLAGIVGFHLPIARIEGKFKLSQNRTPEERSNIRDSAQAGNDDERELAMWMARLTSCTPNQKEPPKVAQ